MNRFSRDSSSLICCTWRGLGYLNERKQNAYYKQSKEAVPNEEDEGVERRGASDPPSANEGFSSSLDLPPQRGL